MGNDFLTGGEGADRFTGGVGVDVFRFATGDGDDDDLITDFVKGTDKLAIQGFTFSPSKLSYANGNTTVLFDVNGNGSDDFELNFSSAVAPLSVSDFVLF